MTYLKHKHNNKEVELTPAQLHTLTLVYQAYNELCDYVGLSPEHRFKIGSGAWLIDYVKQIETALKLHKAAKMAKDSVQGVDNYVKQSLPPLPPVGLLPSTSDNDSTS